MSGHLHWLWYIKAFHLAFSDPKYKTSCFAEPEYPLVFTQPDLADGSVSLSSLHCSSAHVRGLGSQLAEVTLTPDTDKMTSFLQLKSIKTIESQTEQRAQNEGSASSRKQTAGNRNGTKMLPI